MSEQWRSHTNKKLHYARLQLDAWESAEPFEQDAFRDAFLMHARHAYFSLLAEILFPYGKQLTRLLSLEEVSKLVDKKQEGSVSELEQLKQLESSDSWLADLLEAYDGISILNDNIQSYSSEVGSIMIASDRGESTRGVKTPESGRAVLAALKELVGHFRNFNLEW
ncbi:DUF6586 family protein [Endozoicomonas sp. 4G]|uniref:DUF6586 family protein n=1 Tax=Endozoicomonas sp. 4G TaxID=2872754 RepID=UPI0020785CAD|nr:DUF6586 family protein [Endozoicomonas sp. 4G]